MSVTKVNGRTIQTDEVEGATVTTTELDFMSAADLLPELTEVIAPSIATEGGDEESVGKALASMAKVLSGGKLVQLLPRLLKGTTVVWRDDEGKPSKADLLTAADLNRAFTGRKKLAMAVVKIALEVNFRDFFDAADLRGLAPQAE